MIWDWVSLASRTDSCDLVGDKFLKKIVFTFSKLIYAHSSKKTK